MKSNSRSTLQSSNEIERLNKNQIRENEIEIAVFKWNIVRSNTRPPKLPTSFLYIEIISVNLSDSSFNLFESVSKIKIRPHLTFTG